MRVVMTGLSHHTAPLEMRERLSITSETLPEALGTLRRHAGHGVIVGTCNRTEIYTLAPSLERGERAIEGFIEEQFEVDVESVRKHLYTLDQSEAVAHLFRVASGLDSQILGESEVLGQVRSAFSAARQQGASGGVMAHLFHSALRTGKRARTETAIGRNALSLSRACVALARRAIGSPEGKRVLIIGVGEASRLAGLALRDAGAASIVIANRTPANAAELARELDAEVAPLDNLASLLAQADLAVTATAAPDFILSASLIEEAAAGRNGTPLAIMDMAVPRDVDPVAAAVPGVHVYTLDDVESLAEANRQQRESEARQVEAIVAEETAKFRQWWKARGVTPTIAAIRHDAEEIRVAEVARTVERMDGLSEEDARRIEQMTKALVKKLLHQPTAHLRERNDESVTQSARQLFGLDE